MEEVIMLSKISESLDSLSNAERKVAECALSEPKWFVHAAVAEIAEQAQVSQPTVIRFCRSLGYKGLPEFKLALSASISQNGLPFVHAELNTDDNMGDVMEKVLGNTAAALLGALVLVAADALARTVLAPREIPLGILTALVGTPLLMWMMRRHRPQSH